MENAIKKLQQKKIRPSIQRVKILHYLLERRNHPTVDCIYQDILPEMPNLSRTTVYNTLDAFCREGVAMQLDFGEGYLRYDADTTPHSHFYCRKCGRVFDLQIPPEDIASKVSNGFHIQELQLYAFGHCQECSEHS